MPPTRAIAAAASAAGLALLAAACGSSAPSSSSPTTAGGAPTTSAATVTTVAPTPPSGSAPAAITASAGWTQALHDAAHGGAAGTAGPQHGTMRWTRDLGGPVSGGPVVGTDGTIYAFGDKGVLHALDPATGADRWTFDGGGSSANGEDLSTSVALLPDGTILWPGPKSTLFALDAAGHEEWTLPMHGTVLSPAVTSSGKVYVADSTGDLDALAPTATSPGTRWTMSIGKGTSFGSPAVGPDGTVYGTIGRDLVAVTDGGSSGSVKWRFAAGSDIEVSAAVAPDGIVILGTNDPYEYGITPAGAVAWRYPRKVFSYSTPAATPDGLAYFGDNDGYVDVVTASDGHVLGRYDGTSKALSGNGIGVWTAPAVDADHDVYFGTASGHILGFGYGGAKLFDISVGAIVDSYPAITSGGLLVIGSDDGKLYAIG